MNFKIVNRFLVFALSLCTALYFFGDISIQNRNAHLAKISEIVQGNSEHQSIQQSNNNSQPFQIDSRVEQPTEDDENLDTDIDSDHDKFESPTNVDLTYFCSNSLIESIKWDQQSCPIYIRIHSLLI